MAGRELAGGRIARLEFLDGLFEMLRRKTEGTCGCLENHPAIGSDQIEAVRPARIGALGAVFDSVEDRGDADSQVPHARRGGFGALSIRPRRRIEDVVSHIRGHVPKIGGVRLLNVDDIKSDAVAILIVQFVERGNLPAKWRSGIAAENERHRASAVLRRKLDGAAVVERGQFKIGSRVAGLQIARAGGHP